MDRRAFTKDVLRGITVTEELGPLALTAASIGFFHTLLGPDHYVPFIMMSWARKWSGAKTAVVTLACAVGHIGSSVVLGLIGVAFGLAVKGLEGVEGVRGSLAGWLLITFGLAYLVWGIRLLYRRHPHQHTLPGALVLGIGGAEKNRLLHLFPWRHRLECLS